jgi:paraquat-inducible protein B
LEKIIMSKQASKTLIGAFVVGAAVLIVVAIALLGSGKFFRKQSRIVMFFEGAVNGLRIGAPVMFRGVKIGEVTDIRVKYLPEQVEFMIPVFASLETDRLGSLGEVAENEAKAADRMLIDRGLRAQLQLQSLVTGQLLVQFDFFPGTPARYMRSKLDDLPTDVREIPTIKQPFQEISKTIQKIPLDEIVQDFQETLAGVRQLATSPEIPKSLRYMRQTLKDARNMMRNADAQITRLSDRTDRSLAELQALLAEVKGEVDPLAGKARATLDDTRQLVNNLNVRLDPIQSDFAATSAQLRATLKAAEESLAALDDATSQNSEFRYRLEIFLTELTAAARSLRSLTDYLERHPDALLRGKTQPIGGR